MIYKAEINFEGFVDICPAITHLSYILGQYLQIVGAGLDHQKWQDSIAPCPVIHLTSGRYQKKFLPIYIDWHLKFGIIVLSSQYLSEPYIWVILRMLWATSLKWAIVATNENFPHFASIVENSLLCYSSYFSSRLKNLVTVCNLLHGITI